MLLGTSLLGGLYIQRRDKDAFEPQPNDLDVSKSFFVPTFAIFVIGIICNLLGIGGSELSLPLMLMLGVNPLVASSTAPAMSFFSSGGNCLIKSFEGKINWDAGGYLVIVGAVAGYLGRTTGGHVSSSRIL